MINQLTPEIILGIVAAYFLLLMFISYLTSRNTDNADFFIAGRQSPWYLVAFGCLLYTSPSPRDRQKSRMPSSA